MRPMYALLLGIVILLSGCKNTSAKKEAPNDWNAGSITIQSDTNLKPILDQMKPVYENIYPEANVNFQYLNEDEAIRNFINGESRSVIISRVLTDAEQEEASRNQKVEIREHVFAYDAVAVIAGRNYEDSVLALEKIPSFLQKGSSTQLIFDNVYSGIAKQIMYFCAIPSSAFSHAYVVKGPQEVIDYVAANAHAVGFIPFNYISNSYESKAEANRQKIKLLGISLRDTVYQLSQQNIAYSGYPLKRPLNVILGDNPELVGRGFTNFLHRSQAEKILLKSGLVPRELPVRKVAVRDELNAE